MRKDSRRSRVERMLPLTIPLSSAMAIGCAAFLLGVQGRLTIDLDIGRTWRRLGPLEQDIAAPVETVFDVVAAPYLGRTPKAIENKLRVIERGADLVLAEHFTPVTRHLHATTLETVSFERPGLITFRLMRGPVAAVTETFEILPTSVGTHFVYTGEMGADLWLLGRWWTGIVGRKWEATVEGSVGAIKVEAERRAAVTHRA